jgi:outer membrane protein assembly factor BamD
MINSRKLYLAVITIFCITHVNAIHSIDSERIDLDLPSTDSQSQKSRMRKTEGKKQEKASTYKDFTYEKLEVEKTKRTEQQDYSTAIKYAEQMIKKCLPDDPNYVVKVSALLLEIADLLFKDSQYLKASQRYAEFAALNPGSDQIEYALYRAIESSSFCLNIADRDQTKTEETLALADSFLKQDHFTTYASQVNAIRHTCLTRLIESELSICSFYMRRQRLQSAEKRIMSIRLNESYKAILEVSAPLAQEILMLENTLEEKKSLLQQQTKHIQLVENKRTKKMAERF